MSFTRKYRADSQAFDLSRHNPADKSDVPDSKAERRAATETLSIELDRLQDILYGQNKHRLLIILQGMDTSGKDGTIRAVFRAADPLGMRVQAFKAPSEDEKARDYLWRIHQVVPKNGEIVIFNRSHYEDVLVPQVRGWIDEAEFKRRLRHINNFERMLAETGTTIVKIYLNISKEAQRERLQERIDRPEKNWKFNPGDIEDRKLWGSFMQTYQTVIAATDSDHAPWYIVPADSKSSRNVIIVNILLEHLKKLDLAYPEADTSGWPETVE
ncbi:polyphosphate kinase 2 family protein [Uruburuella testudinis]|uniref:Polyphosphate kinase 2 family protein n=1 Tax=Uruburuella testudinis TaxID=1282863 RepID=A0ABY4DQ98_9NEIS|nr:PPK2 family polyphosphate kinase [Uruburuella testudinis]UOO80909.1 polyphosphate kinase 2 family protein [Uruburuella testudinis]